MTKSEEKKISEFFNKYAIAYHDNGTLRLAVNVDQFIFMTAQRMAEREENLATTLKFNLNKLMVAPPHFGVRESITIENAIKVITGKADKSEKTDEEVDKSGDGDKDVKENEKPNRKTVNTLQ